ncbi:helix-hairpin-helix domain-containing protein [Benzoatithermus flavus]|uniref:Helix-hairpin-helix domain-containing protein n=1 Tax=Benzoatithermus flavus TaxID=3108223 RepID=A0ABU8XQH2_9PROT
MARNGRIDVNTATREELVRKAGLRPALAEAILKHREAKGPFAGVDALIEVPGIGAAKLEQLKSVLTAGAAAQAAPVEPIPETAVTEPATAPAGIVAEAAPLESVVADTIQSLTTTAATAAEIAAAPVLAAAQPQPAAEPATEVMEKKAAEVPAPETRDDLASLWMRFAADELNHGVAAWKRLTVAKSWQEAVRVQADYWLGSLDRLLDGSQRCTQLVGRIARSLTSIGGTGTGKAA